MIVNKTHIFYRPVSRSKLVTSLYWKSQYSQIHRYKSQLWKWEGDQNRTEIWSDCHLRDQWRLQTSWFFWE